MTVTPSFCYFGAAFYDDLADAHCNGRGSDSTHLSPTAIMDIKSQISRIVRHALLRLHPSVDGLGDPRITFPRKKAHGDYAAVCFPLAAKVGQRPNEFTEALARELESEEFFLEVTPAGGFLNFRIKPSAICRMAVEAVLAEGSQYGSSKRHASECVMVEYSSPNTNKPLHVGHVRNNLLGMSLCHLLEAVGYRVAPTCLVNDRGIHICKSMVAYGRFAKGQTPATTGEKGDHLVGRLYVEFEMAVRKEFRTWATGPGQEDLDAWVSEHRAELDIAVASARRKAEETGRKPPAVEDVKIGRFYDAKGQEFFASKSGLGEEARDLLRRWEAGDPEVVELWKTMNGWVYEGFDETYKLLGSRFEKVYYESETYLLGNSVVDEGLEKGIFYRKPDGSVWIDFDDPKLGSKLLRRSDGTSVYITQDLGTAIEKFRGFDLDLSVYVVGAEQIYHFQVLFEILRRLGYPWAKDGLYHMAYGMVYLPEGKMKSREGTVVDADDLIAELTARAREKSLSGDLRVAREEIDKTAHQIAMGSLKFFLLSVTPSRDMNFNPAEPISLQGDTGPSVQYAIARINSILEKAGALVEKPADLGSLDRPEEVELAKLLLDFPRSVEKAAHHRNPALICQALLALKDAFSKFHHNVRVLAGKGEPVDGRPELASARIALCQATREVLIKGLALLGIEAPARM